MSKIIVGLYGSVVDVEGNHLGCAGAGKDAFADGMVAADPKWVKYALASPIKTMVNKFFNWDDRHSDGELKEEIQIVNLGSDWYIDVANTLHKEFSQYATGDIKSIDLLSLFCDVFGLTTESRQFTISPRKAYQLFGTEFGRTINTDIWLLKIPTHIPYLILTDVRFPNETQYCIDNGVDLFKIKAKVGLRDIQSTGHSSEQEVKCDMVAIENYGTLGELHLKAEELVGYYEMVSYDMSQGFADDFDELETVEDNQREKELY